MSTPEAVTEDELTKALIHVEHSGGKDGCASCRGKAVSLLEHVRSQREPEYERGQFYEDAIGQRFFRVLGDGDGWSVMPEGIPYPGDYPRRPLRKLVPLPDRLAVLDVLTGGAK